MKVPAILFSSGDSLKKQENLERLEKVAENPEIFDHIAVLSDAHPKSNILNLTGSIVASKNNILPEMMDAAPNCGMRVILTNLNNDDLAPEKIKELFSELKTAIPSKKFAGTKVSNETVLNIFQNGSVALKNIFNIRAKNEFENTYKGGNFHLEAKLPSEKDISKSIPWPIRWLGKYRLGLLGATSSHFLYLMKVSEIKNQELAKKLNIKIGQYVFFMHTGSSIVGRYAASLYTKREIKSFSQRIILNFIKLFWNSSPEKIDTALRAVSNYGFANRALITHNLDIALEQVFGRQIALELLYDAPHAYLDCESHSGHDVIIHRNGANRAYGPQRMATHPIFSQTGEPVLIAPFNKQSAYIGVGTDENTETFFSANHEIGKIKELGIAPEESEEYAERIIKEMEENKIIKAVAKTETVEVLSY